MLTCSQCRFENPTENRFCQRCGAPLMGSVEAAADPLVGIDLQIDLQSDTPPADDGEEPWEAFGLDEQSEDPTVPLNFDEVSNLPTEPPEDLAPEDLAPEDLAPADLVLNELDDLPEITSPPLDLTPEAEPLDTESVLPMPAFEEMRTVRPDEDLPTMVLPMQLARLESAGATHVGRQREHNEDFFDTYTEMTAAESPMGQIVQARGLYILCDGMGGHSAGEVASAMAVEQLKNYFKLHWKETLPDEDCIRQGIFAANQAIFEVNEAHESAGSGRMGTTLVLMLLQNTQVAIAHVGDSRLYAYSRRYGLEQLTLDHEVGQLEVLRGVDPEVAYARPESYQLTQAMGPKDNDYLSPDIQFVDIQEDTLFLLCSDGLSDYDFLEEQAQDRIEPLLSSRASLEQGMGELISLANEFNGHDNITAIAIRAKVRPDPRALRN